MNWSAWNDYVLPDVPGCGSALALQAIREAAIDLCAQSHLYKHDHAAIDIVGATESYALTLPANTALADVIFAAVNGDPIAPRGKGWLDGNVADWRTTATGVPRYYFVNSDRTEIRLVTTPAESIDAGLVLELALKPTKASTEGPGFLLEDWEAAITAGAKARLFAMKRKPWSDPGLSVYFTGIFENEKGRASVTASRDNTRAPLRSTPIFR